MGMDEGALLKPGEARYLSALLASDIRSDEQIGNSGTAARHRVIWEKLQSACEWDDEPAGTAYVVIRQGGTGDGSLLDRAGLAVESVFDCQDAAFDCASGGDMEVHPADFFSGGAAAT